MESPVLAILGGVQLALEALEGRVSDDLHPIFIPQSVAGLLASENIPLVALLENEPLKGYVSPPSHRATSTVNVELSLKYFSSNTGAISWRHGIEELDSL